MEQIGRFKVLRRLGGGGYGEVWLGEDAPIGREVAIKVFKPQDENLIAFATSSGTEGLAVLRSRFVNEARILAGLEASPHVVNVLEFGELEDGSPYYVMPYLPASLTDLLGKDVYDVRAMDELAQADQPRSLPLEQCLDILEQVLAGLDAAHSQGLVHRDIKPSNIMLTESGEIRLVDFGIAKMPDSGNSTVSQLGMGSRNYMAPEQKESAKHVDARADVYAFGTVAYRMITGRLPTGRYSDPNVIVPALHQAMNDLIVQCLQEDHTARPHDGSALLAQYQRVRQQQGEASEETSTWVEQGKSSIRDDLKPLKERIEKLLLAQGEITPENHETLTGLARIVDLDDAELNALIKVVTDEHIGVLKPVQNFLALLDEQVAAGTVKRDMLMVAGNAIGWDETRVAAVIAGRQSVGEKPAGTVGGRVFIAAIVVVLVSIKQRVKAVIKQRQQTAQQQSASHPAEPASAAKASSDGRIFIAAIVVVLVSIGGFWVYEQQQPAAQERRVAEALAEKIRQEVAGWDKAQRVDTIAAYEDYRSQSFATVAHKEEAGDRIAELKRAAESDELRSKAEQGDASAQYKLGTMYDYGMDVPEDDKEAVKWYRLAAEQGDAKAQFRLGLMYATGEGVTEDDKEVVKWYRLAADQGHVSAQHSLGLRYAAGIGVPEDDKEAVKWYRLAADQGDASAQNNLGWMYANGRGVPEDDEEAVKWYRLAADQGDADAQYNLGVMYANDSGVPEDDKEAVKWYRLAADQGYAYAQYKLGLMYANGRGVPEDDKEAVKWYRLAADQGHVTAQYNLGVRYDTGRGVPEDVKEAVKWYRLAADQGDADAQFNLGGMYFKGIGVPEDAKEAVKWYRLAADQGDADAQYNLGLMYANGRGVPEDDKEAVKWYRLAADQGHATAQNNLGVMYANDSGVPEDDKEAVKWYRLAADQGHATAQNNLGGMYANGRGVPEDDKEAVKWYRLAADQGDANGQKNLGVMYDKGRGVPEDDKEAVKWYRLAADQGHATAQNNLGVMYTFGKGVPEDKVLGYMWANLAGANGFDVSKLKELLVEQMTKADISKAEDLTRQYVKDNPAVLPE